MTSNAQQHERATPRVVLYMRRDCHLCEDAQQLLRDHGLAVELIDIDGDPRLCKRFGEFVPVVEINGRVRFRGHVKPMLLRRLLSQLR